MNGLKRGAKILTGFAAAALVFGLSGCLDNPMDSDDVSIDLSDIGEISAGAQGQVKGRVESDPEIDDLSWTILDSDSNEVSSSLIDVNYFSNMVIGNDDVDLTEDAQMEIDVDAEAYNGDYTLKLTVYAGSAEQTKPTTFSVTGGKEAGTGTSLEVVTQTLGSYENTDYGSSLDADDMAVYTVNEASSISGDIDIWYSDDEQGEDVFYSPSNAAGAQHAPKDWSTQNNTLMATTLTPWDDITSQEQIDSLWNELSGKTETLILGSNDVILCETDQGNVRAILFVEGEGTAAGTATIKGAVPASE